MLRTDFANAGRIEHLTDHGVIHTRLNNAINVREFGAVGDGTTDDTVAIKRAIGSCGEVIFPSGTFLISSPLKILSNSRWIGAGIGRTILKAVDGAGMRMAQQSPLLLENVRIEGITFQNNGLLEPTWISSGIMVSQCQNFAVEHCEFVDCAAFGVIAGNQPDQSHRVWIHDCIFSGVTCVPAVGAHCLSTSDVHIERCLFDRISRPVSIEIDNDRHCQHLWIRDNLIRNGTVADMSPTNTYCGIQIELEDTCTVRDVYICGNQFEDNGPGVADILTDLGCKRVLITENISSGHKATDPMAAVFFIDRSDMVGVFGNIISDPAGVEHIGIGLRDSTNISCENNLILGFRHNILAA